MDACILYEQNIQIKTKLNHKGFTLAELLIVVAIIGVLVAISIPIFTSQLERSRESVDLANVRSAYAEVKTAAMTEDKESEVYVAGTYQKKVLLKQYQSGWSMDSDKLNIGGVSISDTKHWINNPKPNGKCRVYMVDDEIFINWGGEDHINKVSASDFLTKDILMDILGENYKHNIINSNESWLQEEGTKKFEEYAQKNGFDLKDYGAETWQIYVKKNGQFLNDPAIYWSTVELTDATVGKYVPVMGYRDGKYDVYYAKVVINNEGKITQYNSLYNSFADVANGESKATFQFDSYEQAKEAYNNLLIAYNKNGTVSSKDIVDNGLDDKKV